MNWQVEIYNKHKTGSGRRKLNDSDKKEMNLMAKLANASYKDQPIPKGYKKDKRSSDQMKILYNPKSKQLVYSIRGTENLNDLYDDLKIFVGRTDKIKRTKDLQKIILESKSDYKGYRPVIVAHSLGSTVGKKISDDTGIEYIGFNRGSSPAQKLNDGISKILNRPLHSETKQTDYVVKSDILSSPWLLNSDEIVEVPKSKDSSHTLLNFTGSGRNIKDWRL